MTHCRTRLAIATLLVTLGLTGCSIGPVSLDDFVGTPTVEEVRAERQASLAPAVSDGALHEAGTLTVGILTTETAPLSLTLQDGTLTGADVDIARALADELGLARVRIVTVADASGALESECDVVLGVEQGEQGLTVVGNYAQSAVGLFAAGSVTAPIEATALSGATVGVQAGSVSATTLDDYATGATQTNFSNLNEAFEALSAGSVDYVACDAYAGAYLAGSYGNVCFAGTLDEPVPLGIAVSSLELESAVTQAIEAIRGNGVLGIALSPWVGDLPELTSASMVTGLVDQADAGDADSSDANASDSDADSSEDASDGSESAE